MTYSIYALIDPRSCEVRYVGATGQSLPVRLDSHIGQARRCDNPQGKDKWIRQMLAEVITPQIEELEKVNKIEDVAKRENFWIDKFLRDGYSLTNIARSAYPPAARKSVVLSQDIIDKLGLVADTEIARLLDVSDATVGNWRKKFGVPIFNLHNPEKIADDFYELTGKNAIVDTASNVRNNWKGYLDKVAQGYTIILTQHGQPAVMLISYQEFLDRFHLWDPPAKEE